MAANLDNYLDLLQQKKALAGLATVIRCRRSANPPETHQRRTAEKLNGKYLELDAGHYPMLSDPDALVPLLLQN